MPVERKSKTVSDVTEAVKRLFGDESGVQITDSDIIRWCDDAQREIVMNNPEVGAGLVQVNVTANQATYPVLTHVPDMMIIHSLHYDNQILPNKTFVQAQEEIIRSGTQSPGTPQFWYEYAGVITLYPVPDTDKPLGLTFYYSKAPTEITSVGQTLFVADSYFKSVVDFCLAQAQELDENYGASQAKMQQFETSMQKQANRTRAEDNVYPTITLLPEDNDY